MSRCIIRKSYLLSYRPTVRNTENFSERCFHNSSKDGQIILYFSTGPCSWRKQRPPTPSSSRTCWPLKSNISSSGLHMCCVLRAADHYKVLGIDRAASPKEIKDAYLKLGKELHPDRNPLQQEEDSKGDQSCDSKRNKNHEKFVRVNEAYSVLGKPESKRLYDLGLAGGHGVDREAAAARRYAAAAGGGRYTKPADFAARASFYGYHQNPNYRHHNSGLIALGCVVFAVVGYIVHYQIAYISFESHRDFLDRRHVRLSNTVEEIRNRSRQFESQQENMDFMRKQLQENREYHEGRLAAKVRGQVVKQESTVEPQVDTVPSNSEQ